MIKITPFYDRGSMSRQSAGRYFHEDFKRQKGMTAADYMAKGIGQYGGKLAERLGLAGVQADKETFLALEHNQNPLTGERLTARHNTTRQQDQWNGEGLGKEEVANRRSGADACFIVPKTLSVAMAENPGRFRDGCQQAILESWRETMEEFESLAMVRVRKGDREEDRPTGNLLYVPIFHEDARPVGADVPDPYVHIHTFIFNATYDPVEGRIKALKETGVFSHAHDLDARFLARLEGRLTAMGVGTERTIDERGRQSFELTSVSKEARSLFSKRHAHIAAEIERQEKYLERSAKAIVRAAAKEGRHLDYDDVYAKQKDKLGVMTRQEKLKSLGPEAKLEALRDQMTPEIRASLQAEAVRAAPRRGWLTVEQAQKQALHTAFKNQSTAHELKVAAEALRRAGGEALPAVNGWLSGPAFVHLNGQGIVTTPYVREEERRMREIARQGWDRSAPLGQGNPWEIQDERVRDAPDQAAAVLFIRNSRDLVMDVSGIAGAGKSTLLTEVVRHVEAQGREVFLLAPTSPATGNLKKDGFRYVDTLQGFQINRTLQGAAAGQVIVVDESSLVSVPQMRWVLDYARQHGCRVILAGDSEQHHSVERGDAVRILEQSLSVRSVELSTNYRARPAYLKAAVTDLWEGRKEEGWQKLDAHGDIREVADDDELRAKAMEQHLAARRAGETSLLACPIHAEAREITKAVLAAEKAEGLIGQEDHTVVRIKKLDADGPERRDPIHYQAGRVVAFHTKVNGGFEPGEKWQVIESEDGTVRLRRGDKLKALDPQAKGKWDLYEAAEMTINVGGQIRINEGFKERGVKFENNEVVKVTGIDGEKITLADGRQINREFCRIDQGVCITSYASECRTVDQIVPALPMRTFAQVNDEAWYVLVSRARQRVVAFTDCKEALHEQVMVDGDRKSVWEHERDEALRKDRERARQEERARPADLQEYALRRAGDSAQQVEEERRRQQSRGRGMSIGM